MWFTIAVSLRIRWLKLWILISNTNQEKRTNTFSKDTIFTKKNYYKMKSEIVD